MSEHNLNIAMTRQHRASTVNCPRGRPLQRRLGRTRALLQRSYNRRRASGRRSPPSSRRACLQQSLRRGTGWYQYCPRCKFLRRQLPSACHLHKVAAASGSLIYNSSLHFECAHVVALLVLQAAEAKNTSLAEKLAAAEKEGAQRAESLALHDEVAEVRRPAMVLCIGQHSCHVALRALRARMHGFISFPHDRV